MKDAKDNQKWIEQLQFRAARIEKLIAAQKSPDVVSLLRQESAYVNAMIDHRVKHGGIEIAEIP